MSNQIFPQDIIFTLPDNESTNTSGNSSFRFPRVGPSIFESPAFILTSYFFIVIGSVAAFMNFAIFCVLVQKKKKMASELLVVTNLLIDGFYGLLLISIGVLNLTDLNLDRLSGLDFANCAAGKVPGTFLIFASLCLVLIMAFNRYLAVKRPTTYKEIFSPVLVRVYLSVLLFSSMGVAGVDLGICIGDPTLESSFADSFSVFYIYAKFSLVFVASIAMILVYKIIAKHFSRRFWGPIAKPFCFCCQGCNQDNGNDTPACGGRDSELSQRKKDFIPLQQMERHRRPDDNNGQPNIISMSDKEADYNPGSSEQSDQSHQRVNLQVLSSGVTSNVSVRYDSAKVDEIEIAAPVVAEETPTPNQSSRTVAVGRRIAARRARRAKRALTLQQQKHYVTTIFFFVCVAFLVVSLPSSLANVFSHIFEDYLSIKLQFRLYLLTEALYGINFVLNPYLFSFNNSYLKDQLRSYRLTKWIFNSRSPIAAPH